MPKINDTYDVGKAFEAIENELIASMIRNMKDHKLEEIKEKKQWSMWQVEMLKTLEQYKKKNEKKYSKVFKDINKQIEALIAIAHDKGEMEQEIEILNAIKNGFKAEKIDPGLYGEFFKLNRRKLEALIEATIHDMEKAEQAILRKADDDYRKIIYNAQMYANSGAATYEKAVDMAVKDMLAAGLTCVEYANGARHTLVDYADMAIKTASKRAYLQGEGEMRQEWGISTVIVNKRGNPCPKCLPFCGKVLIDDVWSGGIACIGGKQRNQKPTEGLSPVTGLKYPLMSSAVAAGLYHPRCKDVHTTYFEGISTPPDDKYTKEELDEIAEKYRKEQKQQYAERQTKKFERLEKYSLDDDNKKKYNSRRKEWETIKNAELKKSIVKFNDSDIMKTEEVFRKMKDARAGFKFISEETFNNLTIAAKKNGAVILRGTKEIEEHLDRMGAAASNIGDVLMFRNDVCISEVLEETYHFEQNRLKMNDDKPEPIRTILNEIDAKKYILNNSTKYKIPRNEIELTKEQLESYKKQLKEYHWKEDNV